MSKIKLSKEELENRIEQAEGDTIELDADSVEFTDGYDLYPETTVENVDDRVERAYDNAIERLLNGELEEGQYLDGKVSSFEDFQNKFKERHDLAEVGEPEDQWKETHVSPLKDKIEQKENRLNEVQQELQRKRESEIENKIVEGARKAGVNDKVISDKERFVRMYKDDFEYDEERGEWGLKDDQGFKAHPEDGNKYAKPEHLFNRMKEQGEAQWMFEASKNKNSGFSPNDNEGTGKVQVTEQQYKNAAGTEKMDKYRKARKEGNLEIVDSK